MKYKLVLVAITIMALMSTFVYVGAETETTSLSPGDNPGNIIDNPWAHLFTTTPTTTPEPTTTEEPTTTDVPTIPDTTTPESTTASVVTVVIDGVDCGTVQPGGSFTLPAVARYGYLVGDKLYKPGSTIENISSESGTLAIDSINSIEMEMANGAAIRIDGLAGIRFLTQIKSIKTCDNREVKNCLNNTSVFKCKTLLVTSETYFDELSEELTLEEIENVSCTNYLNLENTGWYKDVVGYYCAGIINIKQANWTRDFVARGYIEMNFEGGDEEIEYADFNATAGPPFRNIKGVAQAIKNTPSEYNALTEDEKARVDTYASYED